MKKSDIYYVVIVPENKGDFRPCVLEYGISYEKASEKVRWYINDHGLRFKKNGKQYPALIQIHRISDTLPEGYFLFSTTTKEKQV